MPGEVLGAVLVIHEDGDEGAADDAEGVGHDGEKEQHGDAGEDARGDELAHGVDAESAHGVNLFGDDHGAEFAGHGGGVAAGDHDAGEHGAELANHGDGDETAGDGGGAESGERGGGLQGEHAAGEEAREQNDGDGAETDDVGLDEEIRPVDRGAYRFWKARQANREYSCTVSTSCLAVRSIEMIAMGCAELREERVAASWTE